MMLVQCVLLTILRGIYQYESLFIILIVILTSHKPLMLPQNPNNPQLVHMKKQKKRKQVRENEVIVTSPIQAIEYPQHLSNVNYIALDSFEASMEDQITHQTYHNAILQNQHLFKNKIILHITEGTNCLYSIFAARAGAEKVYCVINGESAADLQNIYMMKDIMKENELQGQIDVLSWSHFNAEVDVIIGEPMGYCLHFDGLIDRIIEARDLFLVEKGIILPNILSYKCGIVHDEHFSDHKINFWKDVYGIPMESMRKWISHEPVIRVVDPSLIVSKVAKLFTFDLENISYDEVIKVEKTIQVDLLGPCKANGMTFWFQTFFTHSMEKIDIKASPWVQSTKYTQATLYWPDVMDYKGGSVRVKMKGQKRPKEGFSVITTQIDGNHYQYSFS